MFCMLNKEDIKQSLDTEKIGKNVYYFSEIDSTNTFAMKLASQGAPEGTVIITDYQNSGKGRMGRAWNSSPSMNVLMSLILRPKFDITSMQTITITTANIIISVIRTYLADHNIKGLELTVKWPNDILMNNKKLAGILTESCIKNNKIEYLVVGIGLNVNQDIDLLSEEVRETSTSLYAETGKKFQRENLVVKILQQFEKTYFEIQKMSG